MNDRFIIFIIFLHTHLPTHFLSYFIRDLSLPQQTLAYGVQHALNVHYLPIHFLFIYNLTRWDNHPMVSFSPFLRRLCRLTQEKGDRRRDHEDGSEIDVNNIVVSRHLLVIYCK